jgi:hypothetical protein
MSYYETVGGIGLRGFSEGMGAAFTVSTTPNEELRAIQQDLQHLNLLAPGTGPTGADGRWGLHTASALTQAKTRLHRTGVAFAVTNAGRNITIPDDFIAAIHAAAVPIAAAPPVAPSSGPDATTTSPSSLPSTVVPPAIEETTEPSRMRLYVIGGSVVAITALAAAYMMKMKPNRRRRVRRNRRR